MENLNKEMDIAVIGIGLKIGDKKNLKDYWNIFEDNLECIRPMPENRKEQIYEYAKLFNSGKEETEFYNGTYLDNIDEFDYEFFKMSPREAETMEPAQRLMLETIFETIENAGYTNNMIKGSNTGVFIGYTAGSFKDNYIVDITFKHPELLKYALTGNMPALMPSRASHLLDLKGPTMLIDTACSSSLVAIHQACDSIKNNTCDMAVAGGIKIHLNPCIIKDFEIGIEAADNKTRTFDDGASGAVIGEGVACVLLKPLQKAIEDRDNIYAVIKGSAINHDGRATSITAPNPASQTKVILEAIKNADVNPEDIGYIETHGTGTILGDPIEFQGLTNAFKTITGKKQFCALSASKSNLGHLYECAGIASFIRAIGALQYKQIPGVTNFTVPNMKIDFCNSPFYINTTTKSWVCHNKPRICGVSAFGLSGTNCHVILQEYINDDCYEEKTEHPGILCLSAKSEYSLFEMANQYGEFIEKETISSDVFSYNANIYKEHYNMRIAIVYKNKEDLLNKLKAVDKEILMSVGISDIYYSEKDKKDEDFKNEERAINHLYKQSGNSNELLDLLNRIAVRYVSKGQVNWVELYDGLEQSRIALPTYPFQKKNMWLPIENLRKDAFIKDNENNIEAATNNRNASQEIKEGHLFYKREFVEEDFIAELELADTKECLLIEMDVNKNEELYSALAAKFDTVHKIAINDYLLQVMNKETYLKKMYKQIDFSAISHICFAGYAFTGNIHTIDEMKHFQMNSLLAITVLYKHLKHTIGDNQKIQLTAILDTCFNVDETERENNPQYASIFGMCKSLNREFKNVHALSIDTDLKTDIGLIINEAISNNTDDIVLYREGKRYVEKVSEAAVPVEYERNMPDIRDKGVYLITGGLGGIGYETAKSIAEKAKDVNLVIIGTTPIEEQIIEKSKTKDISVKIERLNNLKKLAGNVQYYCCDIADAKSVNCIVNEVKSSLGTINGVVHAAGLGGGAYIDNLNEERISEIIGPKIFGAYILDKALADIKTDFFIMYSSISTIFSSSDLIDYTAGNIYMEALAQQRAQTNKGLTLAVNWATWIETGMSVKYNFTMDTLFKAIDTKTGIDGLFTAMGMGLNNVVIGELNLKNKIALLLKKYPLRKSDYILRELAQLESSKPAVSLDIKKNLGNVYSKIENDICAVCCEILGYDEISIVDNFFELGADSIALGLIFKEIDLQYKDVLQVTDLFLYPTVEALASYISTKNHSVYEEESQEEKPIGIDEKETDISENDIAVIGVGMALPNADTLEEYWETLDNGINAVRAIPEERKYDIEKHLKHQGRDSFTFRKCGYLDEINKFDYRYFGMSPREAYLIDPVNRLFLQCCSNAIEDSGYGGDCIKGTNTGVFLGYSANMGNTYSKLLYEMEDNLFNASLPLNQVSMAASRTAYVFDLKGPSMVIDTACSSSLVTVHMACSQILNGSCSMALAGGASLNMTPLDMGQAIGFESPENKTRAFSEQSTGTAVGEGVAVILMKKLKDAIADGDSVYGVIKGSSINQDGSSFGIAAPNPVAQAQAIKDAWKNANVSAEDIVYIEAHGTGTQLGDPIEIKGIIEAFKGVTDKKQGCGIGSVKTNIGHLNEAAGMSGLIKILLMFKHRKIVPSLHLDVPNMNIDFMESPVYVVTTPKYFNENKKMVMGINGFGMSGTNSHVILSEPPKEQIMDKEVRENYIFTFSAVTEGALLRLIKKHRQYAIKNPDLDICDVSYNLNIGRRHCQHRIAFYIKNYQELVEMFDKICSEFPVLSTIENCYYGKHAIVPASKKEKYPYEFTSLEIKDFTNDANLILDTVKNDDRPDDIGKLLNLYIKGAEVKWEHIYKKKHKKINLPTYSFDRYHVWYDIPEVCGESEIDHPMPYHYEHRWVIDEDITLKETADDEITVLICGDNKHIYELPGHVRNLGKQCISVFYGSEFMKAGHDFTIPNTVEGFKALFDEVKGLNVSKLVYAAHHCDTASKNKFEIDEKFENGFFDMINLVKGFSKSKMKGNVEIITLGNNIYTISGEETIYIPENAALINVGKVIEQEYPNINCRAVDFDFHTDMKLIAKEIYADSNLFVTGYRKSVRYIEVIDEVYPEKEQGISVKKGGTYVITGGTNGLGLETALHFSKKEQCNIILLSRSGFIEKDAWPLYMNKDEYSEKINIFNAILNNGCSLDIYACDIANYEQTRQTLNKIRDKYQKIDGVVHAAGISGAGYILRKEMESYWQVLAPKVYGIWNLDNLTLEDNLDFMIVYSSAITDSGEAGQSDYIGANAYLDSYGDYRNSSGRKTYTINWVSWKETGMSVRFGINSDSATKALFTKEALEALDALTEGKPRRVMIGQYNVNQNLLVLMKYSKNKFSDKIISAIESITGEISGADGEYLNDGTRNYAQIKNGKIIFIPKSEKVANVSKQDVELQLAGDLNNLYTETEKAIGKVYSQILGYGEVNVYDSFFEMGGDSIMLTEMHDMIDGLYEDIVSVADLFEHTSVRMLSAYIDLNSDNQRNEELSKGYRENSDNSCDTKDTSKIPISKAQMRIYMAHRFNHSKLAYNCPFICDISRYDLDIKDIFTKLVNRHDILRASFEVVENKLVQKINENIEIPVTYVSVQDVSKINSSDYLKEFDLNKAPLFNITVFTDVKGGKMLLFDNHHVIIDGYSSSILQYELKELLEGRELDGAAIQYKEYVAYENEFAKTEDYKKMKVYWAQKFKDYNGSSSLLKNRGLKKADNASVAVTLKESICKKVELIAKQNNCTIFSIMLSLLNFAISVESSDEDIAFLVPVLNHYKSSFKNIIGAQINMMPIRNIVDKSLSFSDYVKQVFKNLSEDIKNQYVNYNELVNVIKQENNSAGIEFNYYLDFQDVSMKKVSGEKDIICRPEQTKFGIDFMIRRRNGLFDVEAIYDRNKFDEESVQNIIQIFAKTIDLVSEEKQHMPMQQLYDELSLQYKNAV